MKNCYLIVFYSNKLSNRRLSHGGHFESQEMKKLCFCTSSLALDEIYCPCEHLPRTNGQSRKVSLCASTTRRNLSFCK